jgi:hypothetical protein
LQCKEETAVLISDDWFHIQGTISQIQSQAYFPFLSPWPNPHKQKRLELNSNPYQWRTLKHSFLIWMKLSVNRSTVVLDATPCRLVEVQRHFWRPHCLHLYGRRVSKTRSERQACCFLDWLILLLWWLRQYAPSKRRRTSCQSTWPFNQGDSTVHSHLCEDLRCKSNIISK